jgi:hypothetical protein
MRQETAAKILSWLMILVGGMAMLAVVPVIMPTAWMETANDYIGLGPFQRSPLMEYLTRSLSLLYVLFGTLTLYLGLNVRRYLPMIGLIGWLTIVLGVGLTGIDFAAGMPASWSWSEGPPTIAIGLAFLWLVRRAGATADTRGS